MAIVGIGLDVTELKRILRIWQRFGESFARRILTTQEFDLLPANAVAYLASRFAAKEAAVKAMGTGFSQGITFQHVEVLPLPSGQPTLALHGKARELAQKLGVNAMHISLTHGRDVAAAVVILER